MLTHNEHLLGQCRPAGKAPMPAADQQTRPTALGDLRQRLSNIASSIEQALLRADSALDRAVGHEPPPDGRLVGASPANPEVRPPEVEAIALQLDRVAFLADYATVLAERLERLA